VNLVCASPETTRSSSKRGGLRGYVSWITRHELWFVLLASPPLWIPTYLPALVPVAFGLLVLVTASRWIVWRRPVPRTALNWPILGLLVALPIGLWVSPDPATSWEVFCRVVLGVALLHALVSSLRGEVGVLQVAWLLAAGGVGISILGLLAADLHADKLPFLGPAYESLPSVSLPGFLSGRAGPDAGLFHPNMIGGALAILIPIGVGLLGRTLSAYEGSPGEPLGEGRYVPRWVRLAGSVVLGLGLVLMCVTLLLTQARMALLAVGLGLCLWGAVSLRRLRLAMVVVALALGLSIGVWGADRFRSAMEQMPGVETWYARPKLWGTALQVIRDYPFTGVGLGLFDPVARANYEVRVSPEWYFGHSHNLLLQAGVDLGLLGLISFLGLLAVGMHGAWSAWISSNRKASWLAGGTVASLVAYVVFGVLNCIPLGSKPGILLWPVLASASMMVPERDLWSARGGAKRTSRRARAAVGAVLGVVILLAAARSSLGYSLNLNLGAVMLDRVQLAGDPDSMSEPLDSATRRLETALRYRDTQAVHRRLGLAYMLQGDQTRALDHLGQDDGAFSLLLLRAEQQLAEKDTASAKMTCDLALRLDPGASEAWYRLGQVSELQEDLDEALVAYERALALGSFASTEGEAECHSRRGAIFGLMNEWDRAESEYASAAGLLPTVPAHHADLGWASYMCCGDTEKAETELFMAIELDAEYELPYRRLIALYEGERRPERALAVADAAVEVAGRKPWGHVLRAQVHVAEGRPTKARDEYEAALAMGSIGAASHYSLAKTYWTLGQRNEAIEHYELAVAQAPGAVWYHIGLAKAYLATGHDDEARAEYAEALRLSPSNLVAQEGVRRTER